MKALVVQTAFLGDAVLTLPLIEKISKKLPEADIDVIALPAAASVFSLSPYVNRIIPFDKKGEGKSFSATLKFAKKIRDEKYDIVVSPHRSARSAIISRISGAPKRISFDTAALSFLYTDLATYNKGDHEVKRNLSLFAYEDEIEDWRKLPEIIISERDKEKVREILRRENITNLILLAPGSVWETKKYPAKYFKEIAKRFSDNGFNVGLIGGNEDKKLCSEISSFAQDSVLNFCGKLTIPQSVELLKNAEMLMTNDSAPTHLGVIAGVKVLTIYTSTIPEFGFYPYNEGSSFVGIDLECKPCGIHGKTKCPLGHFNCGNNLTPGKVIEKAEYILREEKG